MDEIKYIKINEEERITNIIDEYCAESGHGRL